MVGVELRPTCTTHFTWSHNSTNFSLLPSPINDSIDSVKELKPLVIKESTLPPSCPITEKNITSVHRSLYGYFFQQKVYLVFNQLICIGESFTEVFKAIYMTPVNSLSRTNGQDHHNRSWFSPNHAGLHRIKIVIAY